MCQLTFSDLGTLNDIYITNQLVINALDNNPDGVGVIAGGKIWKSSLAANSITNLGLCLKSILNNQPVIGHVRLASNKTLNKVEHAHPFEGELVTQVHNGKLEADDYKIMDRTKVDSENFLIYLEKTWKENPNLEFQDVLVKAMEDWNGKFALMYHVKKTGDIYIARGKTAELHYTTVNGRLVVNTEENELIVGTRMLNQINQLLNGEELKIDKVEELPGESVFKFDPENSVLNKVAEIKETAIPYVYTWTTNQSNRGVTTTDTTNYAITTKFANLITDSGLSIEEIEYMCTIYMGKSLLELSHVEFDNFLDDCLSVAVDNVTVGKERTWLRIRKNHPESKAYEAGLDFPWMFNSQAKLDNIARELKECENDTCS